MIVNVHRLLHLVAMIEKGIEVAVLVGHAHEIGLSGGAKMISQDVLPRTTFSPLLRVLALGFLGWNCVPTLENVIFHERVVLLRDGASVPTLDRVLSSIPAREGN